MIIQFHGTTSTKNNAPQLLCAVSYTSAFTFSKKTLVIELYQRFSIRDLLIGNTMADSGDFIHDDDGIMPILRKAKTGGLSEEHFTIYTKQIFSSATTPNAFDVAVAPKMEGFREELLNSQDALKDVLAMADQLYDVIYLFADGKDEEMVKMLDGVSTKKVVCLKQGNKQEYFGRQEDCTYVVGNYDVHSAYTTKMMRKLYNKDILSVCFNTKYFDATKGNKTLRFLYDNNSVKDEKNGAFVADVRNITAAIIEQPLKNIEEKSIEFDFTTLPAHKKKETYKDMLDVPEELVTISTRKDHFWQRKYEGVTFEGQTVTETEPEGKEEPKEEKTEEIPVKFEDAAVEKPEKKTPSADKKMQDPAPSPEEDEVAPEVEKAPEEKTVTPAERKRPLLARLFKKKEKEEEKEEEPEVKEEAEEKKPKKATAKKKTTKKAVEDETPAKKKPAAAKKVSAKKAEKEAEEEKPVKKKTVKRETADTTKTDAKKAKPAAKKPASKKAEEVKEEAPKATKAKKTKASTEKKTKKG